MAFPLEQDLISLHQVNQSCVWTTLTEHKSHTQDLSMCKGWTISLLNRQIKAVLKGSVSSQIQTLKGCEISTYVWEERNHHLNSPLNLL